MDDHGIEKKRPAVKILEVIAGVLLATAGAATSWSGYQAALWGGTESESYTKATTMRLESTRASNEGGQFQIIDVSVFSQWLAAYAQGDTELEEFYRQRFRPEFKPAFEAWMASRPRVNPDALPTPFNQPEYRIADMSKAVELETSATEIFERGLRANMHSDNYVMCTVIFGMVMFFAGIAQQFETRLIGFILLAVSAALSVMGLYNLFIFPIAT